MKGYRNVKLNRMDLLFNKERKLYYLWVYKNVTFNNENNNKNNHENEKRN